MMEEKIKNLWVDFGELSAKQDILEAQLRQIADQKRNIFRKIQEYEQEKIGEENKKE